MCIKSKDKPAKPCFIGYKVFKVLDSGIIVTPYVDAKLEFNKWIEAEEYETWDGTYHEGFHFWATKKGAEIHLHHSFDGWYFKETGIILKVKARSIIETGFGGTSDETNRYRAVCAKEIFIIKED